MKHKSDFDIDLKIGQITEEYLRKILTNKDNIKIEVKTDFKTHETGNIFIEYEDRNKPSGLSITKADWWAIAIPNKPKEEMKNEDDIKFMIFVKVDYLKKILKQLLKEKKAFKLPGGDNNEAKGVVVRIVDILSKVLSGKKSYSNKIYIQEKQPTLYKE